MADHLSVVLRMIWEGQVIRRRRGNWKTNVALLTEKYVREEIGQNWGRWRKNLKYYSNTMNWWVKAVKQQICELFTCVGSEKRQEERGIENYNFQ